MNYCLVDLVFHYLAQYIADSLIMMNSSSLNIFSTVVNVYTHESLEIVT